MSPFDIWEKFLRDHDLPESFIANLRENCTDIVRNESVCEQILHLLDIIYGPCGDFPKFIFPDFPTSFTVTVTILYVIVFIVAVLGNSAVVIILVKFRRMRTVTNIYLLSLACSDLALAVFCLPFDALYSLTTNWPFGEAMCKISRFVQTSSVAINVLTLTAIAADRHIAIVYPIKAIRLRTNRRAVVLLTVIWFVSALIMSPLLFVYGTRQICESNTVDNMHTTCQEMWSTNATIHNTFEETFQTTGTLVYSAVLLVLLWVVPLLIIGVVYVRIAHCLWTRQHIGDGPDRDVKADQSLKQKKKLVKMLLIIWLLFAACWGPQFLFNAVRDFTYNFHNLGDSGWTYITFTVLRLVAYSNCCCNPIIYHRMSDTFKKHMRAVVGCCKCCRGSEVTDASISVSQH
ncbi:QRFP-like peptide receptor [Saccoglossus kowalevskii]|uniref:Pyroglutamylated RFamide peptide receptor-like n=1 Tax=Saccoglossus kowalevskii TaxID=10224 RepID=A0ABM0GQ75_SACKO|nr:PREDICTED: pyroglutamylated RFamide peptide receptor-like [Saccoglossus kowalevskii]